MGRTLIKLGGKSGGHVSLSQTLDTLCPRNLEPEPTVYGDVIVWERPVQLAAQFFISSGDTVLDIGGNTGGVAIAFARMVGEFGKVYSFECNPKMINWIKRDCKANFVNNISVIPFAAYHSSDEELEFHLDETLYSSASSLNRLDLEKTINVKTITIDDFCSDNDLFPKLIKIDIEGSEADAIRGANETISKSRPVIILEFNPQADNAIELLFRMDYIAYDINTYNKIDTDYYSQVMSTNVICIPKEMSARFEVSAENFSDNGVVSADGGFGIVNYNLTYSGQGTASLNCVGPDDTCIAYFEAEFQHLSHHSCSTIPFYLAEAGEILGAVKLESGEGCIEIASSSVRRLRLIR